MLVLLDCSSNTPIVQAAGMMTIIVLHLCYSSKLSTLSRAVVKHRLMQFILLWIYVCRV